jgi:hypothetical protein
MPWSLLRDRKSCLIVIAITLIALTPFAIHQTQNQEGQPSNRNSKTTVSTESRPPKTRSRYANQRKVVHDLPTSHTTDDLSSFVLPPFDLSQVTLEEGINALLARYRKVCRETSEGPVQFRYTIYGTPDPVVHLTLGGDFLSNCRFIAAMAGMSVEITDDQLLFTEVEDGAPVQRQWTVPPNFLEFISTLHHKALKPLAEGGIAPRISMTGILKDIGVIESDDLISFLGSSSTLIARTRPKNQAKLDGIVSHLQTNKAHATRIRLTDEAPPFPDVTIPDEVSVFVPTSEIAFYQRRPDQLEDTSGFQLLFASFERGFGRKVQIVSFTGSRPSHEAESRFLQSGNVSDLEISHLSHVTFNTTRENYEEENHTFHFKGRDGSDHRLAFTSERIASDGREITIPPLKQE